MSRVLGGAAERLNRGTSSPPRRETASSVYHVISGSGSSAVGNTTLEWKTGDTFAIPAWNRYQHFASPEGETVYLYRFDDKPMLTSLGFFREEGMDVECLVSD